MSVNPSGEPAQEAPQHIEADDSVSDSAYEDDASVLSASVTSSIQAYRHEHGRRYHAYKDGSYMFPNDETENDRLDLQHALFLKSCDNELFLAPIEEDVQHVLDIGTGTGIWAIDFADNHPSADVVGTDLSPIQPSWTPPNLSFLVDDCEDEWLYHHQFDYIHARMMCGSLHDWPRFFEQAFRWVKPGGWIELQDVNLPFQSDDGSLSSETALYQWCQYSLEAGRKLGRPVNAAEQYKKWMKDAGFVDVQEVVHKWPQNPWAKEAKYKDIGRWTMVNMLQGLYGLSVAPFTRAEIMSPEEVQVFVAKTKDDIRNPKIRCYWPIYFVYGRKPEIS